MPGGRKKNNKKRKQEEDNSQNIVALNIHMNWPWDEPIDSPDKETEAKARECGVCKIRTNTKKCTGCYSTWFCGVDCQRKAWPEHKRQCKVETV